METLELIVLGWEYGSSTGMGNPLEASTQVITVYFYFMYFMYDYGTLPVLYV